jgi:hypothetical protein
MYLKVNQDIIHIDNDQILFIIEKDSTEGPKTDAHTNSSILYPSHVYIVKRDGSILDAQINEFTKIKNSQYIIDWESWVNLSDRIDSKFNK